ncbi:Protein kinase-like domain protein [Niveomyces insectorum RCEF 264]|uniref:Protein kinase-like domain protein n=1 Tax=Niveomyces insectorum RCEF 264 TaxID=1081102 RepID=A0A167W8Q3_9HYPO|nr:Protein kinase-like domain protein [Niveomyces insectorum RCEF 264]
MMENIRSEPPIKRFFDYDAAYSVLVAGEIDRLRALINDEAVCDLASSLKNGTPCTIEYPEKIVGQGSLTGCANYHARIRFDDGSPSWLMRMPRVTGCAVGLPVALAEYRIRSEFATLKFLETTTIPAPRAFFFGIPSQGTDRGAGVCFLLMEELPGKPWNGQGDAAKVWAGLADIYAELARHPFTQAGSLCVASPEDLPITISAVASDRFVCLDPYGPFSTSAAYYAGWAEQYLVLIADGQLYPQFPVQAYLVYRFLQDQATQLSDREDAFFLKHVDDKGDHLLVDDDLNITGIIDWQMARVVPRREAFALSLVSADMQALCGGTVSLSANDVALEQRLLRKGLVRASQTGDERMRRFFWGLGLETSWDYALPLANAILQVFGVEQGWGEWQATALKQYASDQRLQNLAMGTETPEPVEQDVDITLFTSETLKSQDKPDFSWKSFRRPKLARCPFSIEDLTFQTYLGKGLDGIVFKAQYEDKTVVLKVYFNDKRPKPTAYHDMYWSFERECMNSVLLEKISTRLQESQETNEPIYVYADPKTHREALYNLRAFADEGRVDENHPPHPGMEPLQLDDGGELHANPCYGWMPIPTEQLHKVIQWRRLNELADFVNSDTYYGIVYEYIGDGGGANIDIDRVIRQLRLFHLAGFLLAPFNHNNWRGDATLIDMSDLVSPAHGYGWHARTYQNQGANFEKWTRATFDRIRTHKYPEYSWLYPNKEPYDPWNYFCPASTFKLS